MHEKLHHALLNKIPSLTFCGTSYNITLQAGVNRRKQRCMEN